MYSVVMSASVFFYQTRLKCAPNAMLELFLSIVMLVIQRNLEKMNCLFSPLQLESVHKVIFRLPQPITNHQLSQQ